MTALRQHRALRLTPAMERLLRDLDPAASALDADDQEIVCERGVCYIGDRRISRATVNQLLRLCLISARDYSADLESGPQYYGINDTGQSVRRRPALLGDLIKALRRRRPFTVREEKIVYL